MDGVTLVISGLQVQRAIFRLVEEFRLHKTCSTYCILRLKILWPTHLLPVFIFLLALGLEWRWCTMTHPVSYLRVSWNISICKNLNKWIIPVSRLYCLFVVMVSSVCHLGTWQDSSCIGVLQRGWSFYVYSKTPRKNPRSHCKALHAAARYMPNFISFWISILRWVVIFISLIFSGWS